MRRYAGLAVAGMFFVGVLVGCAGADKPAGHPDHPGHGDHPADHPVVKPGDKMPPDHPGHGDHPADHPVTKPGDKMPPDHPVKLDPTLGSPENPAGLPKVGKIKVDGNLADWAKIKPLPMPFMKSAIGPVKLAWNAKGIYGAVEIKDKELTVDPGSPWQGDCVEVWIEKAAGRDYSMGQHASQIAFVADPESKTNDCMIVVPAGSDAEMDGDAGMVAKWKKTTTGYVIEFLLPAKTLAPAKMAAGSKIGLNVAVSDDGSPTAQFYCDKNTDDAFRTPELWGTVILKK